MSLYVIHVSHRHYRVLVGSEGPSVTLEVVTDTGLPATNGAKLSPMEAARLANALLAEVIRATEFRS